MKAFVFDVDFVEQIEVLGGVLVRVDELSTILFSLFFQLIFDKHKNALSEFFLLIILSLWQD